MIDTTIAGIKFNQPKRREEVLAEQKYEKNANRRGKNKKRSSKKKGPVEDPNDPKVIMKKQIKEFYAKQGYTPNYETKDGKQVELEFSQ